jgi:hypothetical protein
MRKEWALDHAADSPWCSRADRVHFPSAHGLNLGSQKIGGVQVGPICTGDGFLGESWSAAGSRGAT